MGFARVVVGTNGADVLGPYNQPTLIFGFDGDDVLFGGAGADCLVGGAGVDIVRGNNGKDVLLGGAGSDRIFGSNGKDYIDGGPEADQCAGGGGPDTIVNCEGSESLVPCDADGVAIRWDIEPSGVVSAIRVLDIDATCAGKAISVDLRDRSGSLIGRSARLPATGGEPLVVVPTPLFVDTGGAPCDPVSCTLHVAPVDEAGGYDGGVGIDGSLIEVVDVSLSASP
jgi:Ca2+-binding RTX toxin-like protein